MKNNIIAGIIGALALATIYFGWNFYQLQQTVAADHTVLGQIVQFINNAQKPTAPTK